MNGQSLCIFLGIFKLIRKQSGIFVCKIPLLFAFFSVILGPCLANAKLSEPAGGVINGNETMVVNGEPMLKDRKGISSVVSGVVQGGNVGRKAISENPKNGSDGVFTRNVKSNQGANEGNTNSRKYCSVFDEYVVQSGALGFIACAILWPFISKRSIDRTTSRLPNVICTPFGVQAGAQFRHNLYKSAG